MPRGIKKVVSLQKNVQGNGMPALFSPPGMDGWRTLIRDFSSEARINENFLGLVFETLTQVSQFSFENGRTYERSARNLKTNAGVTGKTRGRPAKTHTQHQDIQATA